MSRDTAEQVVRCDLCGFDAATHLATGLRFGIKVSAVMCGVCGLVYQNPRMGKESLGTFYDKVYRDLYSGSNDAPTSEFLYDQIARGRRVLEFCRPWLSSQSRVLDVGSGPGGTLVPFDEAGHTVAGVEPGPYAEWGSKNLGLKIIRASEEALDAIDLRADLALLSFVLEHVSSPRASLARIRSVLVEGGLLFIEVPNLLRVRGPLESYFHVAHLTYFTPATLTAMLRSSGFNVVHLHAGRAYSMRLLARKEREVSPVPTSWIKVGDDPAAIRSLMTSHARYVRFEYGLKAVVLFLARPANRVMRAAIGPSRTEVAIGWLKGIWRKTRYGD